MLLALTGGPGQLGVGLAPRILEALPEVFEEYRLVMLDQRGTGQGAIDCPRLQAEVGGSDIAAPSLEAVRECAAVLGDERRFYSTADTVADLDMLRRALGVDQWTIDGVSYGSYTAERYAVTFPDHVRALVLDSVVPHDGFDPFIRANLRRTAVALRDACADPPACPSDPAEDLAWVIRHGVDGVGLLDALTLDSIIDASFREIVDVPRILRRARLGDPFPLERFISTFQGYNAAPADQLSAGLHAATLCNDLRFPWDPLAPLAERREALRRATARIPQRAVWPFDRATAAGHGMMQECLFWPPMVPTEQPVVAELPDVPVLLLQGERDLSTPLSWARREAAAAPDGRLVVVPDSGHSVQVRAENDAARQAVAEFLLGE